MITLHHGDCLEVMKDIPANSVDMVLCDLPYGTTYAEFEKVLKNMHKFSQTSIIDLGRLWAEYERVLKIDGTVVLFGAQPFTTTLISSKIAWYKYSWVWEKNKAANHVAVKFQPLKVHEDILVFSRGGCNTGALQPIRYNPQGVIWGDQVKSRKTGIKKSGTFKYNSLKAGEFVIRGTNYPRSILRFSVPSGKERLHSTQKPVDLCEYLIKTYSNENDVVLDNCAGSFTTGVACVNLRRKFIGIEKDKTYFNSGVERIKDRIDCLNLGIGLQTVSEGLTEQH